MKYAAIFFLLPTIAFAGGYNETVLPPGVSPVTSPRPMPRPDNECQRFLFWIVCDTDNPSPKREREDAPERPKKTDIPAGPVAQRPDPALDAPKPGNAPIQPEPPVEPPAPPAQPPEPPVDEPPQVEPPKDKPPVSEPPAKPQKPKKDRPHKQKEKHHDRRD